jgi:hypothetical protein
MAVTDDLQDEYRMIDVHAGKNANTRSSLVISESVESRGAWTGRTAQNLGENK